MVDMDDRSFDEALADVEAFMGVTEMPVFEGTAIRGVVSIAMPEVCEHGNVVALSAAQVRIYGPARVHAWFACGCVMLGRFRENKRVAA